MNKPILDLKRDNLGRFVVGTVPPRRQKGQRNRFGERFIRDLHDFWREHGPDVIMRAAVQNPSAFIRSISIYLRPTARDMPFEEHGELDHLTTTGDVIEAIQQEFGPEVAKAMLKSMGMKATMKVIEPAPAEQVTNETNTTAPAKARPPRRRVAGN